MINLDNLKYFLAVARHKNFTKAAISMFYSQSYLSKRIATLEKEIGVELFERDNRRVKLTTAGEFLYNRCLEVNNLLNEAIIETRTLAGTGSTVEKPIKIYCDSYCSSIAHKTVDIFIKDFPKSDVHIYYEVLGDKITELPDIEFRYENESSFFTRKGRTIAHCKEVISIHKSIDLTHKHQICLHELKGFSLVSIEGFSRHVFWENELKKLFPEIKICHVHTVYEMMQMMDNDPRTIEIWDSFFERSVRGKIPLPFKESPNCIIRLYINGYETPELSKLCLIAQQVASKHEIEASEFLQSNGIVIQ